MKLKEALNEIGRPFVIEDCSRDNLPEFFKEMGYKIGAEIGPYHGEFTAKFCEAGLKMYAIDPWIAYLGAGRSENKQDKQDTNYDIAKRNLGKYDNCEIIRSYSMDALSKFENNSLDFVYIDGDHRFRYIAEDITEWTNKVKKGGVVSGHDYFNTDPWANNVLCQVKSVVDAYIDAYRIEKFYIFGKLEETKQKNDRFYSWMFIK